jgi:hypothetical protein
LSSYGWQNTKPIMKLLKTMFFHLISNKYWKIQKHWDYWLNLQRKHGILPRDEGFKATSAFDVRAVNNKNVKKIGTYCSKKISRLYTDFYTDFSFVKLFELLTLKKEIEIKIITQEYCRILAYPITKNTLSIFDFVCRHFCQNRCCTLLRVSLELSLL